MEKKTTPKVETKKTTPKVENEELLKSKEQLAKSQEDLKAKKADIKERDLLLQGQQTIIDEQKEVIEKESGLRVLRTLNVPKEGLPKGHVLCNDVKFVKEQVGKEVKLVASVITCANVKMPSIEMVKEINRQKNNTLRELKIIKEY